MAPRFKKTIQVVPGINITLSNAWVSVSLGSHKGKVTPATALMILVLLVFTVLRLSPHR